MKKLRLLFFLYIIVFSIVVGKLFYLQVVSPKPDTENEYLKTHKIHPERGKIYDRNGLPLAVNKSTYLLYLEPQSIPDPSYLAEKIHPLLEMETASIEARIDASKEWVAVKNGIEEETRKKILSMGLPGIGFQEEYKRFYPEASLAAHILGFVGKEEDGSDTGYFGIEGYFNKDLEGLAGFLKSERDFLGRPILVGTQERVEPQNGRSIYLTIDKSVQEIAKSKLKDGMERYRAKEGCVIVADPMTMEILAFSCLPDFDLDNYFLFSESYFKNPGITDLYEPGSTFKPLIVAAAIEEKKIKPTDTYDEEGPVEVGDYTIRTWDNKYEGRVSMTRILEKSSNVGMVHIGEKLGAENVYSYIHDYGFGKPTNIDLQGENPGFLKRKAEWYPIDYATATFGQGIAVTPIQMIRAFSSLVNGGKLLEPHIVRALASEDRKNVIEPKVERVILKPQTSEIIKKMLVSTVENGEIRWAKPEGYTIGGKTGTAQIPIAGHYDPNKTVASFIGFAPADKPKFIALVVLKEPESSPWGSETAAPLFFEIAKDLLVYYNIAPQ